MFYREIHSDAQQRILKELKEKGHAAEIEFRKGGCIFDVFDKTDNVGYEVVTAKFWRSAHEQDEAIVAKMLRYLLVCRGLNFVVATANEEDLDYLHSMGIAHWHYSYSWMGGYRRDIFTRENQQAPLQKG